MCSVTAVRDSSSARTRQVAHRVQGNEMAATGLRTLKKQTHIDVLLLQLILTGGSITPHLETTDYVNTVIGVRLHRKWDPTRSPGHQGVNHALFVG